ncbi:MAG: type II toxin-antitoxin system VapC family toxin [Myxococcaceae bacterium]|nr:type II toxin-antitoxin system VapC family toxin [Myxococcaceae bacterium]
MHLRRGRPGLSERLAMATEIVVPTIVIGELVGGFRNGSQPAENEAVLERFLGEPSVSVAAITQAVARRYGAIYAALKRAGRPIPTNDMWIAACAQEAGAHLLSFDSDFGAITDLSWSRLS